MGLRKISGKKGFVESQFAWVFILLVGGLILLFFISIVNSQKKDAELTISATLSKHLHSILTGVGVSSDTAQVIEIPKSEIGVDCNSISVGRVSLPYENSIFFGPDLIKGAKIITWTKPWKVPYKVTNFVILTSPEVRYIVVNDTNGFYAEELFEKLPSTEIISKKFVEYDDLQNMKDDNYYKIRFIFFEPIGSVSVPNLNSMPDRDVSAINIIFNPSNPNPPVISGQFTYYHKSKVNSQFTQYGNPDFFLGESGMIAAIFSEDDEMYNCSLNKAWDRFHFVTHLIRLRANDLKQYYPNYNYPSNSSKIFYFNSTFKNLLDKIVDYKTNPSMIKIGAIADDLEKIEKEQNVKLQEYSATLLY